MTKIGQMTSPLPDAATLGARKDRARAWFEHLRDDICTALETAAVNPSRTGWKIAARNSA